MNYSRNVIAIGLVGCLLAFPLAEARALQEAQPPAEPGISDWRNLQHLRAGRKIRVVQTNLRKVKGRFLAWTEEAITLRVKKQELTIPREEVHRVMLLSKSNRVRNALIGMGVGAAVGGLIFASARGGGWWG